MQKMPGSALCGGRTQLTDCSGAGTGSQRGATELAGRLLRAEGRERNKQLSIFSIAWTKTTGLTYQSRTGRMLLCLKGL